MTKAELDMPNLNISLPSWWWIPTIIALLLIAIKAYYIVVPPDQAHVVVYPWGRRAFTSKVMIPKTVSFIEEEITNDDGEKEIIKRRHEELGDPVTYPSAYFRVPIITQRIVLPTTNIPINIKDIVLHDKAVAPFVCDVACWVVIDNPIQAAERIGKIYHETTSHRGQKPHRIDETQSEIEKDVVKLITAVSRTAAMKVEILELMRDRKKFSNQVEDDTDVSLKKWGLELVDLEVLDIKDAKGYTVIVDNEKMVAQRVNTMSRVDVAGQEMEANIAESDNRRLTRLQVAENEETSKQREIAKDQAIAISEQEKTLAIQEATQKANEQQVNAERTLTVGQAEYNADASIKEAEGTKQSDILKAQGAATATLEKGKANAEVKEITGKAEAEAKRATGEAEGDVIKAALLGEADGKDKLADAEEKLQKSAMIIQLINAAKEVQIETARAYATALESADLKVIAGGDTSLLGQVIGPQQGAGLAGMITSLTEVLGDDTITKLKEAAKNLTTQE